ncbi:hypothetical protein A9P82_05560 [Arachidicoccus ginsenosidimutans]|uniref:sensor histidine kinase n=1 Tax=Arachidicoccus sp. BS20 TaxID=1850526 RepID=UPI0007F05C5A|nr:histidine kinase [Arachidicoccus sp. BS20]ANI88800.1 hypothetical protein A9P82_05560 [Arachidicoccus sp. BS20]
MFIFFLGALDYTLALNNSKDMKQFITLILLLSCGVASAQHFDTSKYVHIGNFFVDKSNPDLKYLRTDGISIGLIDIRKATPQQLESIKKYDRIEAIYNEHTWYNVYEALFNFHDAIVPRFETGLNDTIYNGSNNQTWGNIPITSTVIDGKNYVEFADVLIDKSNAKNYRYHVIQNDNKEIVAWTTPDNFLKTKDGKYSYAYLGKFNYTPNQTLRIEIYNVNNYADRSAYIADWRGFQAFQLRAFLQYKSNIKGFDHNILFSANLDETAKPQFYNCIETKNLNNKLIRLSDSIYTIQFSNKNYNLNYDYRLTLKKTINGKTATIDLGTCADTYNLDKTYWNEPGKYEIIFTPTAVTMATPKPSYGKWVLFNNLAKHYSFTVLPDLHNKISFSLRDMLLLIGLLLLLFLVIYYFIKTKNARKIALATQQKETSKLQLEAVRNQLNPHFMFNALTGIQNLMNKNKTDKANEYLSSFSRITRNILDGSKSTLISISEEKSLLDDYLKMEQLRFNFHYSIIIDKNIDADNIEIPAMLLQPLIENAVKHGISDLNKEGNIEIRFSSKEKKLLLEVVDDGEGFDTTKSYDGYGLQLTRKRISLLNAIYTHTKIEMNSTSNNNGTTIQIVLNNWLEQ